MVDFRSFPETVTVQASNLPAQMLISENGGFLKICTPAQLRLPGMSLRRRRCTRPLTSRRYAGSLEVVTVPVGLDRRRPGSREHCAAQLQVARTDKSQRQPIPPSALMWRLFVPVMVSTQREDDAEKPERRRAHGRSCSSTELPPSAPDGPRGNRIWPSIRRRPLSGPTHGGDCVTW
jgi:hypothetical protein